MSDPDGQEREMRFPMRAAVTLVAPRVPQTTAEPAGTPVRVEAVQHEDGRVSLTMDPGTAATVMDLLTTFATDMDATYRRGATNPNDRHYLIVGSAAYRARTVIDAAAAARFATGARTATYDID